MPNINTLAKDIYNLLDSGTDFTSSPSNLELLSKNMGSHLTNALKSRDSSRELGKLWFSDLGEKCDRKTYYKFNTPNTTETLESHARFKFLYGDILEDQVLFLAREAGHTVSHEQERVEYNHKESGWKVTGRIDACIDDVLIDVKSCSSFAYKRYQYGVTDKNDSFGYAGQLSGYWNFAPINVREAGFLFVDKQNGFVTYTPHHDLVSKKVLDETINRIARLNVNTTSPPQRAFREVDEGNAGNKKVATTCSYCPYKFECWKDSNNGKGLRVYRYSKGPVFMTHVTKEPRVEEITKQYIDAKTKTK
jgi:hypothetical protein